MIISAVFAVALMACGLAAWSAIYTGGPGDSYAMHGMTTDKLLKLPGLVVIFR
jgi:hypothetical protein